MAQLNYTPDLNDQYTGVDALPPDTYKVQIIDSDIVESKSGDAEMVKLTYEVVGHERFDGRKLFDNIIIAHKSSADAVRIGKQKLNTICALTGLKGMKDTAQMHGKTLSLLVGQREYNGSMQNTIKKYLPFNSDGDQENDQTEQEETGTKKPKFVK